ncbi:unnamed protein product [Moneuplotes crassus]|uniref:Uncharacterized protein n=2 Tax=Euplotes crassus TaxID=5936 RepID=A0AAD1U6Z2_EUPCR|nr:unnamed protein product [Moneuplotes crassus]
MANKKRIKRGEPPKSSKALDLKSPRTLEAIKRQGYDPQELQYLREEEYIQKEADMKATPAVMRLRYKDYEENRREKVRNVKRETQIILHEKKKNNVKSRANSQKKVKYRGKLGPAPKRIPNAVSQSLTSKKNKINKIAIEAQLKDEAKQFKMLQTKNKAIAKQVVKKAIQEEQEDIIRAQRKAAWSDQDARQKKSLEEAKLEHKMKILAMRNKERERIQREKELSLKKYKQECIKKEKKDLINKEYEDQTKIMRQKSKEILRLKRENELQEYITSLKLQKQQAEEIRRESFERKIQKAELQFEKMKHKKDHEQLLKKLSIHKKLEEANKRVKSNLKAQEKSWEEKQKMIVEKYNRIKLIQKEKEKIASQRSKLKELEHNNAKGRGDGMLNQRLKELREKELKFESRIKIHKQNMQKEIDKKRKFHSFQSRRMEQRRKLLEEEKEKEKSNSLRKLREKDRHTEKLLKHRNEESRILAEFESLKRDKRLNEAKRLKKVREYQKIKEFERIQEERSKSQNIQEQRKKILSLKIEENEKIKFIKEQLKEKIKTAKGYGMSELEDLLENPYKDLNTGMNKSMENMINKLSMINSNTRRSPKKRREKSPRKAASVKKKKNAK